VSAVWKQVHDYHEDGRKTKVLSISQYKDLMCENVNVCDYCSRQSCSLHLNLKLVPCVCLSLANIIRGYRAAESSLFNACIYAPMRVTLKLKIES
jgi:hypothetical protein